MIDILKKLRKILNRSERRNAVLLFIMILCTGIMEAVGVASIMPFLSVLSNPEVIQENTYLSYAYEFFNFSSSNHFLLFLGTGVFFIVVFGLGLKSLTIYGIARFSHMRNYSISTKLLQGYLARPYSWFLNRHSADLGKTILSEVQQVIGQAVLPTAQFIAHSVIAACLIIMLFLVDPWVAVFAITLLGGSYAVLYSILRKYLSRIGGRQGTRQSGTFSDLPGGIGRVQGSQSRGYRGWLC